MLKTLKNQSRKKILFKAKTKNFLKKELWVYIVVFSSIALCSWIFNKWTEGVMFCIAHTCIRNAFDKQFHFNKTAYCLSLTLAIIWFAIPVTPPLSVSLLSSIPICFLISFLGFIAQDRVDFKRQNIIINKQVGELLAKLRHKKVCEMNDEELYNHCKSCGLDDVECKIANLVIIQGLKGKELYEAINYSEAQTKRKRKKILESIR